MYILAYWQETPAAYCLSTLPILQLPGSGRTCRWLLPSSRARACGRSRRTRPRLQGGRRSARRPRRSWSARWRPWRPRSPRGGSPSARPSRRPRAGRAQTCASRCACHLWENEIGHQGNLNPAERRRQRPASTCASRCMLFGVLEKSGFVKTPSPSAKPSLRPRAGRALICASRCVCCGRPRHLMPKTSFRISPTPEECESWAQHGGATASGPASGSGYEIILQGFNWESHRQPWYKVRPTINLCKLLPPSKCASYLPSRVLQGHTLPLMRLRCWQSAQQQRCRRLWTWA